MAHPQPGPALPTANSATAPLQVKEEPHDVVLVGYHVTSQLRDEVHDGDFPGLSWAMVASATEIEKDSPAS